MIMTPLERHRTINEPARREVLAVPPKLNRERYAEGMAHGLRDIGRKREEAAREKSKGAGNWRGWLGRGQCCFDEVRSRGRHQRRKPGMDV